MEILLVDNDPYSRDGLWTALRARGHCVTLARDATTAYGLAGACRRAFDLVITAVTLPGAASGLHLCRALRREHRRCGRHLPVLVITSRSDPPRLDAIARAGAVAYVLRPLLVSEVLAQVEWIARRFPARVQPLRPDLERGGNGVAAVPATANP